MGELSHSLRTVLSRSLSRSRSGRYSSTRCSAVTTVNSSRQALMIMRLYCARSSAYRAFCGPAHAQHGTSEAEQPREERTRMTFRRGSSSSMYAAWNLSSVSSLRVPGRVVHQGSETGFKWPVLRSTRRWRVQRT